MGGDEDFFFLIERLFLKFFCDYFYLLVNYDFFL